MRVHFRKKDWRIRGSRQYMFGRVVVVVVLVDVVANFVVVVVATALALQTAC